MGDYKIPINRLNKWFSEEDWELEQDFGEESISDNTMTVVLFRVDKEKSQTDDLYHEANANEIRYKQPIELDVVITISDPENKTYNDEGTMRYLQDGALTFGIFQRQLDRLKIALEFGDYIGYAVDESNVKYYSVVNDGNKFHDDKHQIMGYKGTYRTIICAPVDEEEFSGI